MKCVPPTTSVSPTTSKCTIATTTTSQSKASISLALESKGFLISQRRTTAYRAASYRPTLETFTKLSFSDYVRKVLLGVPLEGVPSEDPYFSCCSTSSSSSGSGSGSGSSSCNGTGAEDEEETQTGFEENITRKTLGNDTTETRNDSSQAGGNANNVTAIGVDSGALQTEAESEQRKQASPLVLHHHENDSTRSSILTQSSVQQQQQQTESVLTPSQIANTNNCTTNNNNDNNSTKPTTRRMATRSQTRPNQTLTNPNQQPQNQNTNGTNGTAKNPNHDIYRKTFHHPLSTLLRPNRRRKRKLPPLQPLQPDELKLTDGIAKITPPFGWWDKSGIQQETTGTGPTWSHGGYVGSRTIPSPIRQCVSGIGGVYDLTMMDSKPMTVAEFRDKAYSYRKKKIGKEVDEDTSDEHMEDLARRFWRRLGPTMEAPLYGADMEGTLFDGHEACGWNVDRLESCLQLLRADSEKEAVGEEHFKLPGVTSAYLYFGMWASTFAAHTEDMNLLSINYLHAGAPKYWYAIAAEDSDRFETLMASQFSVQAASCSEFLRHKSYLLSPSILTKAGISYTTQVQRAGDFMITFPGSYHFGFNTGFNCAESTNFAVPEWVPHGETANVCMCHPHSVRIDINRFKYLLDKYERETSFEDGHSMSYDQWAKLEVKRRKRALKKNTPEIVESDEKVIVTKKIPRNAKVVEVSNLLPQRKQQNGEDSVTTKKKKRRKKKKNSMSTGVKKEDDDESELRLAINARKSAFRLDTKVICQILSEDGEELFILGTVTHILEEHVRVHFLGTAKNEDIWMQLESPKLFLDGGSQESMIEKKGKGRKLFSDSNTNSGSTTPESSKSKKGKGKKQPKS